MLRECLPLLLAQGGNIGEGPGWGVVYLMAFVAIVAVWGGLAALALLVVRSRARGRPQLSKLVLLGFGLGPLATGAAVTTALLVDNPIAPFAVVYFGSLLGYCWAAGRALARR